MRLHFGFSKRIKVSTLIKILGFLFFGALAYFGLTDHAFAWTTFNQSGDTTTDVKSLFYGFKSVGFDFYTNSNGEIISFDCDFATNIYCGMSVQTSGSTTVNFASLNQGTSQKTYLGNTFNVAIQTGFPSNSNIAEKNKGTTHYYELYLKNETPVCTSDNSNKSVNIRGSFIYSYTGTPAISDFNEGYSIGNIITTKINAYDDTNDRVYITSCNTTYQTHNGNYYHYTYECPNVYIGDSNTTINKFGINFINNMPFEDMYKGSGTGGINGTLRFLATKNPTMYSLPSLSYECSTDNPIVDNQPSYEDSLKNVSDDIKNNYDTSLPGIETDLFLLQYPNNIQELISLPIYLLQNILENGTTCSVYELDFSSLTTLGSNGKTFKIQLPCMRTELSRLLGSFYNLIDVLMASFVFYYIALHIIELLDVITSGVDLWSYYFSSTNEGRKFRHGIWGD